MKLQEIPMKTTKCKKHYSYKAILKPRTACEPCWRKYFQAEDARNWVKYAKDQLNTPSST